MSSDPFQRLIERWRASAVVQDGRTTCVNHAFYACADDLEALIAANNLNNPTLVERVKQLQTYAFHWQGTEFGGLVERDKVLAILSSAVPSSPVAMLDPSSEAGQRIVRNSAFEHPLTQGDPPPSSPVADFKQMLRDEIACQQEYAASTEPHAGITTPREHRHTVGVLRAMLMLIEFKESQS